MQPMNLNGWRRVWIVWSVLAIPFSMALSNVSAENLAATIQREKLERLQVVYSRASDRRTALLDRELGSTGDPTEMARRASIVLAGLRSDEQLRKEQAAIDAEFALKIDAADREERQQFWLLFAMFWIALTGGVYMVGVTVAWIRRGFANG